MEFKQGILEKIDCNMYYKRLHLQFELNFFYLDINPFSYCSFLSLVTCIKIVLPTKKADATRLREDFLSYSNKNLEQKSNI